MAPINDAGKTAYAESEARLKHTPTRPRQRETKVKPMRPFQTLALIRTKQLLQRLKEDRLWQLIGNFLYLCIFLFTLFFWDSLDKFTV